MKGYSIKVCMGHDDMTAQELIQFCCRFREGRCTSNDHLINAVDGNVYPVEIVLGIDIGLPFLCERTTDETSDPYLGNGCHVRVGGFNLSYPVNAHDRYM